MRRYPENPARRPRPLDAAALEALAIRYVGRYATTRAKLVAYLERKIDERGWQADMPPAAAALAGRLAELGYIDDQAFATMRAAALARRGFGERRVSVALRAAGISEADGAEARTTAQDGALQAALAFARRKRIGPYALAPQDREGRERAIAALIRAGHEFTLARRIAASPPGTDPEDDTSG